MSSWSDVIWPDIKGNKSFRDIIHECLSHSWADERRSERTRPAKGRKEIVKRQKAAPMRLAERILKGRRSLK